MSPQNGTHGPTFDGLDEFDWSITNPDFKYPEQPYLSKTRIYKTNTIVKTIRTGKCYEKVNGLVKK